MSEMTVKMLEQMEPSEQESYKTIKEHIERNILLNQSNQSVLSKYLWIKELFEWLEDSGDTKLIFEYLHNNKSEKK